jgi:hypothetical protein
MAAIEAYVRRRRILLASAGVLPLLAILVFYSGVLAARVTVSWSYDYTRQPACSASRPNNCIDHFEILDYTDAQHPKLLSSVPNPPNAVGKVDNISNEFSYGPPFGQRTIVVVAVARDEGGTTSTSNPYAARKDVEILHKTDGANQ